MDRYAEKMHIRHVVKGCRDKAAALREFAAAAGIELADDLLHGRRCERSAGDADCRAFQPRRRMPRGTFLAAADFIAKSAGGNGAVRELIETLLAGARIACARGLQPEH